MTTADKIVELCIELENHVKTQVRQNGQWDFLDASVARTKELSDNIRHCPLSDVQPSDARQSITKIKALVARLDTFIAFLEKYPTDNQFEYWEIFTYVLLAQRHVFKIHYTLESRLGSEILTDLCRVRRDRGHKGPGF